MNTKAKKKSPSWIDVKRKISGLEKNMLLELLGELYRLSDENKDFFNTRFSLIDNTLEPYKRIIQKAVNPSLENNEDLNLKRAKNEILRYPESVAQFLLNIYFEQKFIQQLFTITFYMGKLIEIRHSY